MPYEVEFADDITLSELDEFYKENKHLIKDAKIRRKLK
jgi:hypothetical protein